jgi:hypothetical protein
MSERELTAHKLHLAVLVILAVLDVALIAWMAP